MAPLRRPNILYVKHVLATTTGDGLSSTTAVDSTSNIPEIDGSAAGFIILVVALAVIVLVCCIAVFFLLRDHSPTPYERQLRRAQSLQRRQYAPSTNSFQLSGLRGRISRLFGRRRAEGWVRANDDDWDTADDRTLVAKDERDVRDRTRAAPAAAAALSAANPLPDGDDDPSAESVELAAPVKSPMYTDPFSTSPTSMTFSEVDTRADISDGGHAEQEDKVPDPARFSVQSRRQGSEVPTIRSMRKFESGTKFKESIEF
ncbi:uncharacterized protein LAESUDRAFT_754822 [Laetiporus sulphureus 93-53]|uniref:Uncharacterized protein n=1 Tax=Laetiporus sulphureus 93-53 TaxID=1314785 RepID=A0A165H1Y6_9APHY|nr:uncharacterized protein LAESUDRAFT_754822 [Laetiporus sulphureus 93-53]KZT11132.1 hypothetical protein LAESUDRAFT_754822 [Laetiporus sulphureus 93-53]